MSHDIYPMPMFPTLEVRDPASSLAWYREVMGFDVIFEMPGPGGALLLAHVRRKKYADLLLRRAAPGAPEGERGLGITVSFQVDRGEVDRLAERARAAGARIVAEPGNRPWNARDFTVADPDGFRLVFTEGPVEEGLTMDAVVARARREPGAGG